MWPYKIIKNKKKPNFKHNGKCEKPEIIKSVKHYLNYLSYIIMFTYETRAFLDGPTVWARIWVFEGEKFSRIRRIQNVRHYYLNRDH